MGKEITLTGIATQSIAKAQSEYKKLTLHQHIDDIPNMGYWEMEFNARPCLCTHGKYSEMIFMLSELNKYHNSSLQDKEYMIYAFDLQGKFINKINSKKAGSDFFDNIVFFEKTEFGYKVVKE